MAGEQPGKHGSGGSILAPTLSPSLAHPSISSLILTCFAQPACIPFQSKEREVEQSSVLCPGSASAMGRS